MVLPLVAAAIILVLDQITKALIVAATNNSFPTMIVSLAGDFLQIRHDRNLGIAFSGLNDLEGWPRILLLIALPIAVVLGVAWMYFRDTSLNRLQRWSLALILAGGTGNIIDRIFRSEGVVDFISVKFYGLFGFERWPTFNVADASLVVGGIVLVVGTLFFREKKL